MSLYFYLVLTVGLVLASRRTTRKTTSVQHEEGSCYAPHFRCPDWAPCCSKNGFCGNTADYCSRQNCLANCWSERRGGSTTTTSSEEEERRRERRRRQEGRSTTRSGGSKKPAETILVTKANYYSRKGYK